MKYKILVLLFLLISSFCLIIARLTQNLTLPSAGTVREPAEQAVISFTLINADTDQSIATFDPLNEGATLNLTLLPTINLNIRANTQPATVGSVRFRLDGNSNFSTENSPPYALAGDSPIGNYKAWTPNLGWHTLTATPYTEPSGTGTAGTPLMITFNVIDDSGQDTGPLSGQIIVDPQHPEWLKHYQGGPFFMCGPGDPEGFLYRGARNHDGTRDGDQMQLIDKLKPTGANSIYLIAVRSHGGDGDSSQNPFIDSNPSKGLDDDILNQWEQWFTEMDNNGIMIFFFFYDDSARIWNTGDSVGPEEHAFIQELVNKFEHHKNLIWVVAEEYEERYSAARVSNIAAEIRAADDHDHVIAVHKHSGLDFSEFADDPNIDQFAIQYYGTASQLHEGMVTAWNNANGRYNLNMAEADNHGTGATARKKNWAVAMGGAYVMVFGWDVTNTPKSDLEGCGQLVSFFESTNFNEMHPHDQLAYGGTEYVLAKPGESYIAYASALSGDIGLKNMTEDTYTFRWLDISSGVTVEQSSVHVDAGDQSWMKPAAFDNELAVYITKERAYDINGDGIVNIQDLFIVAKAYQTKPGDENWDPRADLDGNDLINIIDLYEVAKDFGKTT